MIDHDDLGRITAHVCMAAGFVGWVIHSLRRKAAKVTEERRRYEEWLRAQHPQQQPHGYRNDVPFPRPK